MKQAHSSFGYLILAISMVVWLAAASLFFIDVPYKINIGVGLYVLSYILWFIAGWLLGKETLTKLFSRKKSIK